MQWIAAFFIATGLWSSLSFAGPAATPAVRVRIKSTSSAVSLSGLNIRFVGLQAKYQAVAIPQTKTVEISRVTVAEKSYWQISENNLQDYNVMTSQQALLIQGENLREGATALPNKIVMRENEPGQIDVIGVIPLEEYILDVLVNEMPLSWPMETLKAQAIAIRSYTKAVMRERETKSFHVESSVLDQVYRKIAGIPVPLLEKAQRAVKETEGIFLTNIKGNALKAFYHADCGGKTKLASSVWSQERDNDAGTAVDEYCEYNPRSQWRYKMSKEKFRRILKSFSGDLHSNEFRKILGFMDFKSTNFEILDREDHVEFVGKGFGHGVGLCQWGSKALGLRGGSYQRILKHYYPLASLKSNFN